MCAGRGRAVTMLLQKFGRVPADGFSDPSVVKDRSSPKAARLALAPRVSSAYEPQQPVGTRSAGSSGTRACPRSQLAPRGGRGDWAARLCVSAALAPARRDIHRGSAAPASDIYHMHFRSLIVHVAVTLHRYNEASL